MGAAPLIGRTEALATLTGALACAGAGGCVVSVEGEPGIGKTRLIDEALAGLSPRVEVCRAAARELRRTVPFGLLADALGVGGRGGEPARKRVAELLRGGEDRALDLRFAIAEGMLELVDQLATRGPLVAVLEDVHWADDASLDVVARLAESAELLGLVLVCSLRPHPRPRALTLALEAAGAHGCRAIALEPLGQADVEALVAGALGAAPGPNLRARVATAGGNPLYVTELVAALADELRLERGIADTAATGVPPSLALTIIRHLGYLAEPTLTTLRMAAVLGARFDPHDLALLTDAGLAELAERLEEARRATIVAPDGEGFVFRHDLIRDALYDDLAPALRRAMHAQIAQALDAAGRPAAEVAPHVIRGLDRGHPLAIDVLRRAAQDAAPRSPAVAAELLEQALSIAGPGHPQRLRLELELASALVWSGQAGRAEEIARRLLRADDADLRHEALTVLASALWRHERVLEVGSAVEDLGPLDDAPAATRATLLALRSLAAVYAGRLGDARVDAEHACALAEGSGDSAATCVALFALAALLHCEHRLDEMIQTTHRAAMLALDPTVRTLVGPDPLIYYLVGAAYDGGRRDEALALATAARGQAESADPVVLAGLTGAIGHALWAAGNLRDAVPELEAAVAMAEETGEMALLPAWATALAHAMLCLDDLPAAKRWLERSMPVLEVGDVADASGHRSWLVSALLDEAGGDSAGGARTLRAHWTAISTWNLLAVWGLGPHFVRIALAGGDRELAEEIVSLACASAGAEGYAAATARGSAHHCRALLERDADLALAAIAAYRTSPDSFWLLPEALEDAAAVVSDREQAIALLREALECWEAVGAVRYVARTDAALRALGVRRGVRGRRARPGSGWESLTDAELRVCAFVGEGLTYGEIAGRLFLSRRTVETHVAHVFTKLGIASRRDLATIVAERSG
jgi:DNA-binding CsgD family transcriptional regulator